MTAAFDLFTDVYIVDDDVSVRTAIQRCSWWDCVRGVQFGH
jgi:hypothetical protein